MQEYFSPVWVTPWTDTRIPKKGGEAFGGDFTFEHRGPARTVFVGMGLAPGSTWQWVPPSPGWSHGTPTYFICQRVEVKEDLKDTLYQVYVEGEFPTIVGSGSGTLDVWKFLSFDAPYGDEKPLQVIHSDWDDDVYSVTGGGTGDIFSAMMPMMMMFMMMSMVMPMMQGLD